MAKNPELNKNLWFSIIESDSLFLLFNIKIGNSTFSILIRNLGQKWVKIRVFHQKWAKMVKNREKWSFLIKISENLQKSRKSGNFEKFGPTHENGKFYYQKSQKSKKNWKILKFQKIEKIQKSVKISVQKSGFYNVFSSQTRNFCPARPRKIGQKSTITS